MEVLPLLRALWRRRLLIGAGLLVAVLLAVAFARPQHTSSAVAWTRVALDTPNSQLIDSNPAGASTLPWRASLMMHLTSSESARRQLAQRLGVRYDQVAVVDPALSLPEIPASIPTSAAKAAAVIAAPYVLTVTFPSEILPIVSIRAAAPDRAGAVRLAQAAVALLQSQGSSGGTYESLIKTDAIEKPGLQAFIVNQVAPVHVKRVVADLLPTNRLAAIFLLFLAWCVSVVVLPRLLRGRKIVAAPIVQ
jgi:hypothetical protein